MALQKQISYGGFTSAAGYYRVMEATVSRRHNCNIIVVHGYANADEAAKTDVTGRLSGVVVYDQTFRTPYKPDSDIPNAIETAYSYLKLLPEFADAQDV